MLVDRLVASVLKRAEGLGLEVTDYCAGLRYCYTVVSDGSEEAMGLAYLPRLDIGHDTLPEAVELGDALKFVSSTSLLHKTLGISMANAVSQFLLEPDELPKGDVLDYLELRPDDKVVLVGYMRPIYEALDKSGLEIVAVERDPMLRSNVALPDTMLPRVLEDATACIATGSCLVNDTLDLVVREARKCRIRALVGPTAQLLPDLLHSAGFTHVASIHVSDVRSAARAVLRGGGTKELLKYSVKYVSLSENLIS
ncbi:hypothetical protein B6U66_02250 [Candidatus Bathyarchaeota archaeon ex4484_135]|nr:MAG: hypothetical protein B6U66_02250 [Candidatus Bathyarchaeota archaeon ex4484_135]